VIGTTTAAVLLLLGLVALVGTATAQDTKDKQKAVGAIRYEVTADELAKEFKDNAAAARKKYDPNPPKGGAGGAIIAITGELQRTGRGEVSLKNDAGLTVLLRAKNVKQPPNNRQVVIASGKFNSFNRNTITIDADSIEFKQIVGQGKDKDK
jgi:hypothetical protein